MSMISVRFRDEHVYALAVVQAAEGLTFSAAMRWLIERYAAELRNPSLLDALPAELHDQIPSLWDVARTADRPFDQEQDTGWVVAHDARYHLPPEAE